MVRKKVGNTILISGDIEREKLGNTTKFDQITSDISDFLIILY